MLLRVNRPLFLKYIQQFFLKTVSLPIVDKAKFTGIVFFLQGTRENLYLFDRCAPLAPNPALAVTCVIFRHVL